MKEMIAFYDLNKNRKTAHYSKNSLVVEKCRKM